MRGEHNYIVLYFVFSTGCAALQTGPVSIQAFLHSEATMKPNKIPYVISLAVYSLKGGSQ
jgi:hypothetical protein